MTEERPQAEPVRRPRPRLRRAVPGVGLLVLLAAGVLIGPGDALVQLQMATPDRSRVTEMRALLARLPERPLVLVGMDADLGTYPEIRGVARAAFDDLLSRGGRLAFISFTTEGRAVAAAELDRLAAGGTRAGALMDAGYVAGAEAGMVLAVTDLLRDDAAGAVADTVRDAGGGMAAFDMVLVVGGVDLGARSWVEQVGTRLPELPIVAIAPTFAHPELAPYLRTGQLAALLATLRDGAAYVRQVEEALPPPASGEPARSGVPSALAMLLGMIVALGALGRILAAGLRRPARADAGPVEEEDA
ncbi:MAG: hypothetical protein ACRDHD_09750 [Candidatus Limnocylindria bacterium]